MKNGPETQTGLQSADGAFQNTPASGPAPSRARARSRARPYVLSVLFAGCVILANSVAEFCAVPPPVEWWVLVGLTLISGSAVLKIPSVSANFSISDVFTLTSAVILGPAAGTLIVAIDSLAISARLARTGLPLERILFNAAAPPVAMWLSATVFFYASGFQPLYGHPLALEVVGPWLLMFAALYFLLNTFAIAIAIALHERVSALAIWRAHFQSLWFTFIGGALGAGFVVFALRLGTYAIVILFVPLLLALILHFAYRNSTGRLADQLHHLAEVNRLHLSTIEALAHAIDAKDAVTHGHIRRVQSWAVALAARIGLEDEQQLRAIEAAALLHDIGKLAVPEHILNKPGKLTQAEFERMKSHARVGAEILSEVEFPYPVVPIVRHHHENWDGSGYPDGLKGADIPIGARILSVVDCFDALTSDRPYRRSLPARDAFAIIQARRGTMYDPAIVDAFRDVCVSSRQTASDSLNEGRTIQSTTAGVAGTSDPAMRERRDELRIAFDLGASLAKPSSGGAGIWGVLADALLHLPGVDTVAIFVVDEQEHRLVPAGVAGTHAEAVRALTMPVGERLSGWVAATGQGMVNGDAGLDLLEVPPGALCGAMAVPCAGPDGVRVVMTLYSTAKEAFSSLHERLLSAAGSFLQTTRGPGRVQERRVPRARIPSEPWRPPTQRPTSADRWNGLRHSGSWHSSGAAGARTDVNVI
jgi:putative nucleotidyltransferase with HDIG domain